MPLDNLETDGYPTSHDARGTVFKGCETVRQILDDSLPIGVLDGFTVTNPAGLAIAWTKGEVYTRAVDEDGEVQDVDAGGDDATADSLNYLVYVSGSTLVLRTTPAGDGEIGIAHMGFQDGILYDSIHEEDTIRERIVAISNALADIHGTVVVSGLEVSEDADVTNALDVKLSAGTYYHEGHEEHTQLEILSRTVALVRWFHTAGVWDHDTDAEVDPDQYDDLTDLVAASNNKYHRSLFLIGDGVIHWIYGQAEYVTSTLAIAAVDPLVPPGLSALPKSTALVTQEGDLVLPAAGSDRWIDRRPLTAAAAAVASGVSQLTDLSDVLTALATAGYVLRANGTQFVGGQLGAADLSDGVTGTGAVVRAVQPVLTAPFIGTTQWTNATHTHLIAATGGVLSAASIQSGTLSGARLAAKHKTRTATLYIEDPEATDSFPLVFLHDNSTLVQIRGVTDVGTVDFNIEHRGTDTPDQVGTNTLTADLQAIAAGDSASGGDFADATVDAERWLNYNASAVASSPTKLWVVVEWTIDD